jgi:hypothetical protein
VVDGDPDRGRGALEVLADRAVGDDPGLTDPARSPAGRTRQSRIVVAQFDRLPGARLSAGDQALGVPVHVASSNDGLWATGCGGAAGGRWTRRPARTPLAITSSSATS